MSVLKLSSSTYLYVFDVTVKRITYVKNTYLGLYLPCISDPEKNGFLLLNKF